MCWLFGAPKILLIAPEGIEITVILDDEEREELLLIAPEGIEIP